MRTILTEAWQISLVDNDYDDVGDDAFVDGHDDVGDDADDVGDGDAWEKAYFDTILTYVSSRGRTCLST